MKNTVKIYYFLKWQINYVTIISVSKTSKTKHVHIKMETNVFCSVNNESIVRFSAEGAL